ncbi:MAG: competence/damage-inducible protein A [Acidimicrobiales bacterium]|nr:competence/damage-inducible protein A [Acidimicrobiales bacterium]
MRCEVLAVGTELLLGQVVDTNSAWIGEQLAAAGIDSHHQTKVGDNQARIVACIRAALARSDAVVCCGGLGPTKDDITREAIAEVLGVPLELDEEVAVRIEEMFSSRGRTMPVNNMRQAEVPKGAAVIPQVAGTAPGLICRLGDRSIYAVPGVPHEMREMVARAVIPDLVAQSGQAATIFSRTLRTWGLAESALDELLGPHMAELDRAHADGQPAPTIAFLASGIEGIKVRITAKAPTQDEAESLVAKVEAEVRALLGPAIFGADEVNMEAAVGALLASRGLSLGVAESLTGGLVGSRLTVVPGASEWFRGSLVVYASAAKRSLLGVSEGPVVREPAAIQMAVGAARVLDADVGLALTGVAGPSEQDGEPIGTVWVGLAGDAIGGPSAHRFSIGSRGSREQVRQIATISALDLLRRRLLGD